MQSRGGTSGFSNQALRARRYLRCACYIFSMSRRVIVRIGIPAVLISILLLIYYAPPVAAFIYETIAALAPVWLPLLLLYLAWPLWLRFAREQFVTSVPYATLELKPGPETPRSAKPMELVFYSLYHRVEITKREYLLGHVRLPWSFEVYAHAGTVRFFVHLPENHRSAIESRVRSEYTDMDIEEVRDYSREIPFHAFSMQLAIREYALAKPDPYPLKTYEHYESQDPKRDLFAEMLEELATLATDGHILISYIIRPHQRERTSYFQDPHDTLHEDAYRVIGEILGSKGDIHALLPAQQAIVLAIEGGLKKPSFDCGIRALYVAERHAYNEANEQKLETLFQRFNDDDLNGFVAHDPAERSGLIVSEAFALSRELKAHHFMRTYRSRSFFAPPYVGKPFVLNTEELATVFHMPPAGRGSVLAHHRSVKLEPPENLPV